MTPGPTRIGVTDLVSLGVDRIDLDHTGRRSDPVVFDLADAVDAIGRWNIGIARRRRPLRRQRVPPCQNRTANQKQRPCLSVSRTIVEVVQNLQARE